MTKTLATALDQKPVSTRKQLPSEEDSSGLSGETSVRRHMTFTTSSAYTTNSQFQEISAVSKSKSTVLEDEAKRVNPCLPHRTNPCQFMTMRCPQDQRHSGKILAEWPRSQRSTMRERSMIRGRTTLTVYWKEKRRMLVM